MDVSATGTGHRCYEVRRALGPDPRHEMPQRAFAELLNARAEALLAEEDRPRYDSSVIARIEKGDRRATVIDTVLIADVDPQARGWAWVAIGEESPAKRLGPSVIKDDYVENPLLPRKKAAAKKRNA